MTSTPTRAEAEARLDEDVMDAVLNAAYISMEDLPRGFAHPRDMMKHVFLTAL